MGVDYVPMHHFCLHVGIMLDVSVITLSVKVNVGHLFNVQ